MRRESRSAAGEIRWLRETVIRGILAVAVVGLAGLVAPEGSKVMAMAAALVLVVAVGWWKG